MVLPLNWRVIGFLFTVAAITGALFGIIPALKAARTDANAALKPGGRGIMANHRQQRLRTTLVASELVLALALLTGAGFFVEGTWRLAHLDFGWDPKNILTGTLGLPYSSQYDDPHCREFAERLQQKLAVLPGVNRAAISAGPLPWGVSGGGDFGIEGRNPPLAHQRGDGLFQQRHPRLFFSDGNAPRSGARFQRARPTGFASSRHHQRGNGQALLARRIPSATGLAVPILPILIGSWWLGS